MLGLALVQSSAAPLLRVAGVHPDLVVMAVVAWTLMRGPGEGLVWAVIGGLGLDLLSSGPVGVSLIALAVTGLLASLGYGRVFGGYLILPLTLAFPLSLAYYVVYAFLLGVLHWPVDWLPALSHAILPACVLNMAAMCVLFPTLRLLHRRTGREEISW